MSEKLVLVFDYINYRDYLIARYEELKKSHKFFSYRYFAKMAGLGSSGYLKMVVDGKRNLSPNMISKFNKAFKHNKKESSFFESLVLYNQARNDQERDHYLERLTALKPPVPLTNLEKDKYEYFTQRHFVIIREMVALPDFNDDPAWIAKQLNPPISTSHAAHALEVLLRLKLISKNSKGKYELTSKTLSTPAIVPALEIYQYHNQMLSLAKEALIKSDPHMRDISALTIPIPLKRFSEICHEIQEFRKRIIDMMNQGDPHYDEVYQLNIQCFPVTNISNKS